MDEGIIVGDIADDPFTTLLHWNDPISQYSESNNTPILVPDDSSSPTDHAFRQDRDKRKGSHDRHSVTKHVVSEKRRREKMREQIIELRELIPNCKKPDRVSVLEDAVRYLKELERQVRELSDVKANAVPPYTTAGNSIMPLFMAYPPQTSVGVPYACPVPFYANFVPTCLVPDARALPTSSQIIHEVSGKAESCSRTTQNSSTSSLRGPLKRWVDKNNQFS